MAKEFYLKHHSFHIKAIFTALKDIFEKNEYADKAIEKVMKANPPRALCQAERSSPGRPDNEPRTS